MLPLRERLGNVPRYQNVYPYKQSLKLKEAILRFSEATKRRSIESCASTAITYHKSHSTQCCYLQNDFLIECMITNQSGQVSYIEFFHDSNRLKVSLSICESVTLPMGNLRYKTSTPT